MGSDPAEKCREHLCEEVSFDGDTTSHLGGGDLPLSVRCVGCGGAGQVEQVERPLAVERRHLPRRAHENLVATAFATDTKVIVTGS